MWDFASITLGCAKRSLFYILPRGNPWYHFLRYDPKNPHPLQAGFYPSTRRLVLLRANLVVPVLELPLHNGVQYSKALAGNDFSLRAALHQCWAQAAQFSQEMHMHVHTSVNHLKYTLVSSIHKRDP